MRTIDRTTQFKKDYKRESKGRHGHALEKLLIPVVAALAKDMPLSTRYRDHALGGSWADHRDCHYRKPNNLQLQLVRLGSHSELSL